ncbi:MAG: polyprenyl synthetase family protein [Bacillota bacterium]
MTDLLEVWRERLELELHNTLRERRMPQGLKAAMEYALFPGGKRLRPLLTIASCVGSGGNASEALVGAAAVELVHCYSLVHDDMPEMDNSPTRRGRASLHAAFGQGVALLVGDALLTLGFELLGDLPPEKAHLCVGILARCAGGEGMVGGQYMDMFPARAHQAGEGFADFALTVARLKTGRLFGAAAGLGWVLGSAHPADFENAVSFGEKIGTAFQILDDIEDWTSGEDQGKWEIPAIMSTAQCRTVAAGLIKEALELLRHFPVPEPLEEFVALAIPKDTLDLVL